MSPDYTLSGSTLTLGGPATISVAPGLTTVSSELSGTSGYSVSGGGILFLNGPTANTITGPVSVTDGSTLALINNALVTGGAYRWRHR